MLDSAPIALPRKAATQPDGACSMGFVGKLNERHLVSCGSDAAISIRSIAALDQEPSTTYTKEAVSMLCMAASPTGSCFAIGDQQSYVKVLLTALLAEYWQVKAGLMRSAAQHSTAHRALHRIAFQ